MAPVDPVGPNEVGAISPYVSLNHLKEELNHAAPNVKNAHDLNLHVSQCKIMRFENPTSVLD